MALDDGNPQVEELFATASRIKPQRTYSHKGRGHRELLPALKPTTDAYTPANTGVKLRRFRLNKTKRMQPETVTPAAERGPQTLRAEEDGGDWDGAEQSRADEDVPSVLEELGEPNGIIGGGFETQSTCQISIAAPGKYDLY